MIFQGFNLFYTLTLLNLLIFPRKIIFFIKNASDNQWNIHVGGVPENLPEISPEINKTNILL